MEKKTSRISYSFFHFSFFLGNIDMVMACRDPMESMKPAPAQDTHSVNIQGKKLKPLFTEMFTRWFVYFFLPFSLTRLRYTQNINQQPGPKLADAKM